MVYVRTTQLCSRGTKAATDNVNMAEYDCVPMENALTETGGYIKEQVAS